jgi:hypothetical protein
MTKRNLGRLANAAEDKFTAMTGSVPFHRKGRISSLRGRTKMRRRQECTRIRIPFINAQPAGCLSALAPSLLSYVSNVGRGILPRRMCFTIVATATAAAVTAVSRPSIAAGPRTIRRASNAG